MRAIRTSIATLCLTLASACSANSPEDSVGGDGETFDSGFGTATSGSHVNGSGTLTSSSSTETSASSTSAATSSGSATSSTTVTADGTTSSGCDVCTSTSTGPGDTGWAAETSDDEAEGNDTLETEGPEEVGDGTSDTDDSGSGSLLPQSDDFEDPEQSAGRWLLRDVVEGSPAQYTLLDFGETTPGSLTIVPTASGWYGDFDGPFVYTTVTGDFMVETEVAAYSVNPSTPTAPPSQYYNSAGLLMRDPNHGSGTETWITHNVGYQDNVVGVGTEAKRTVQSNSRLFLFSGVNRGRLRICRVGDTVWLTRKLDGEATFALMHIFGDGEDVGGLARFPDEVQVGMSASAWNSLGNAPNPNLPPDIRAEWSYIHIWPIGDLDACLTDDP